MKRYCEEMPFSHTFDQLKVVLREGCGRRFAGSHDDLTLLHIKLEYNIETISSS